MSSEAKFLAGKAPLEKGGAQDVGEGASPRYSGGVPPSLSISNNCTEAISDYNKLLGGHKRMAEVLTIEIQELAKRYGIERLGFLTLTFSGEAPNLKEAQRRFHSLNTHILRTRYEKVISIPERGSKNGRLHFHLVVVLRRDIRTGCDFQEIEKGVYLSANQALRAEWAFWRKTAPLYGFGRTELLPVKSNAEGIARYVGSYIKKQISQRNAEDKGARLVNFSGYGPGERTAYSRFAWNTPGGWLWRKKLEVFCKVNSVEVEKLEKMFGPKWCYLLAPSIMSIKLVKELGEVVYPGPAYARADGHEIPNNADEREPVTVTGVPPSPIKQYLGSADNQDDFRPKYPNEEFQNAFDELQYEAQRQGYLSKEHYLKFIEKMVHDYNQE